MIPFPKINPNIVEIGPITLRWYGLMYVAGFLAAYFLIQRQPRAKRLGLHGGMLQDLFLYLAIGLVVGARLGYVLFYQYSHLGQYVQNPLEIIAIWHGGMSFHGGLVGTLLAGALFCRRKKFPFWVAADLVIVTAPIGLGLGRLGNFINGELYGRASNVPWAMVFPGGGPMARHPSQIYEVLLEGVLLFILLWALKDRDFKPGAMVCFFLGGYGILRFIVEFFREPDAHIGLLWGILSMGQVLCLAMVFTAIVLWIFLPHRKGP